MNFREGNVNDLPKLKKMYGEIVTRMRENDISIWNETYPYETFSDDIRNNRLYVLTENENDIVASFVLCVSNDGESFVEWESPNSTALYLDRFGVNVNYSRRGFGGKMLEYAIELAREKKANYLRLFVVDINKPATDLYLKNGFKQVEGLYEERIDDHLVLYEYGFEIEV